MMKQLADIVYTYPHCKHIVENNLVDGVVDGMLNYVRTGEGIPYWHNLFRHYVAPKLGIKVSKTAQGLPCAVLGEWRCVAYASGGGYQRCRKDGKRWRLANGEMPADVELLLARAIRQ